MLRIRVRMGSKRTDKREVAANHDIKLYFSGFGGKTKREKAEREALGQVVEEEISYAQTHRINTSIAAIFDNESMWVKIRRRRDFVDCPYTECENWGLYADLCASTNYLSCKWYPGAKRAKQTTFRSQPREKS